MGDSGERLNELAENEKDRKRVRADLAAPSITGCRGSPGPPLAIPFACIGSTGEPKLGGATRSGEMLLGTGRGEWGVEGPSLLAEPGAARAFKSTSCVPLSPFLLPLLCSWKAESSGLKDPALPSPTPAARGDRGARLRGESEPASSSSWDG
jgi:hypothetical protein